MERIENIVGKGENAGNQHFLLFLQCFQKATVSGSLKVGIVWFRVNTLTDDKILDLSKLKQIADDILKVERRPCNHDVRVRVPGTGLNFGNF